MTAWKPGWYGHDAKTGRTWGPFKTATEASKHPDGVSAVKLELSPAQARILLAGFVVGLSGPSQGGAALSRELHSLLMGATPDQREPRS